jgi:hypothetical protein
MPLFDYEVSPSTPGQNKVDDIDFLIHCLDRSINQELITTPFSSPSSASTSSSSAVPELYSPIHINLNSLRQEELRKSRHEPLKKKADRFISKTISINSPSSTASSNSSKTVYSNLSTPTAFSETSVQFENKTDSSLLFLNPFVTPTFSLSQGSQSVPATINAMMQSYFEPSDSSSNVMDVDNDLMHNDPNRIIETQRRPTLLKRSTSNNPSYVPQFGRPFETKTKAQQPDEGYWMKEQALASDQIKDFDLLIESLAAQGKTKTFSHRKRAPSKTFEDIMPYLSVNTQSQKKPKTSLSNTIPWQSMTQIPSKETEDDYIKQNLQYDFLSKSQRQRSKTTSSIYIMEDAPIIPSKATFSEAKAETYIPQVQSSGLVMAQEAYINTDIEVTMCKFVEQAAKTALMNVKVKGESEISKRAIVGSKARDEQNREKSKRYYDRKKAQNSAMTSLCTAIKTWQSTFAIRLVDDVQELILDEQFESTNKEFQIHSERQKALKETQKMKEAFQIKQLMSCAEKLIELQKYQPRGSIAEIVLSHSNIGKTQISDSMRSREYYILEGGLHIWLDYLHCWADLLLAEKRLTQKAEDRPICDLLSSLTELL